MEVIEKPAVTPLALIQMAVEKGVDASQMERLVALHERYVASRAAEAYAVAMQAAQAEMPVVLRETDNSSTNKKYANLESVKRAVKPVYTKHGFTLSFGTADSPLKDHYRVVCDVRHTGGHEKRYFGDYPSDLLGPKGNPTSKTPIQAVVSMTTYAQRNLTCMIFDLVIADTDDDGNAPLSFVTPEQIAHLNTLIEDTGTDIDRFLAWCEVPDMGKITQGQYLKAVAMIRKKKTEGK